MNAVRGFNKWPKMVITIPVDDVGLSSSSSRRSVMLILLVLGVANSNTTTHFDPRI